MYYIWKDKIEYKNNNHPQDYHSPGSMEYYDLIMKGFNTTVLKLINLLRKNLNHE
jgi:hypothetical protein